MPWPHDDGYERQMHNIGAAQLPGPIGAGGALLH